MYFACLESSIILVNMTCRLKKIATVWATLTLVAPNLALAGNEPALDLSKAAGLAAKQQYSEAIELYTAILEGDSSNTEDRGAAYYLRGIAEQEIGMTGHAIADFTQAIWLGHLDNKELATAHFRRGKGYALLKQYSRAITDFDRAIQLEPSFSQAYSERGDAYRNRGIYKLALQDYSTSIRLLNPDLHIPYFGRGLTHEAMGNERLASADFRRASELEPEFRSAQARLAKSTEIQFASTGSIEVQQDIAETEPVANEAPQQVAQLERQQLPEESDELARHASENADVKPNQIAPTAPADIPAERVADAGPEKQNLKHSVGQAETENAAEAPIAKELAANAVSPAVAVANPSETARVAEPAAKNPAPAAPEKIASNTTSTEIATEEEATGAIPEGDRDVSATAIRKDQTAAATEQPANTTRSAASDQGTKVAAKPNVGKFLVQIASYREKDDAQRRFDKLSAQHQDLFSDLSPDILRADLGEKGIYYRLRIGPFQSFQRSTDVCNALKERQLDCLVIKRKSAG